MSKYRSHIVARFVCGACLTLIISAPVLSVSESHDSGEQTKVVERLGKTNQATDLVEGSWEEQLRLTLESMRVALEGTGGTALDPADIPEDWMSTLADVYAAEGIRPDMTEQEEGDLLNAIDDADLRLDSAPSSVYAGAVADCETLLDDMRAELLGAPL